MKLSQQQFESLLKKNNLALSLIGMSNIGKTYWSKKLSEINFKHINCDGLIEAKLAAELKTYGYSGIKDISRWMGQPYDKRFFVRQQKYLASEKEVMGEIFARIKNKKSQNIVIDTTGSIVHIDSHICSRLKKYSLVVYIKAPENIKEKMFNQYINKPKPVIFGNIFKPKTGETNAQTLKQCYQKLLDLRDTLYAQHADIIIPRNAINKNMEADQFILLIKQSL